MGIFDNLNDKLKGALTNSPSSNADAMEAAFPACDDPAPLMAEHDGYTPIDFSVFYDRDSEEEFKSGQRFKSVATVAVMSKKTIDVYTSEEQDDYTACSYSIPLPKLDDGDDVVIYYKTREGDAPSLEKLVKLSPLGSEAWKANGGFAPANGSASEPAASAPAFCGNCGAKLGNGAKFCDKCGQSV